MNIKEDGVVYEKDGFKLAIKDIKNGDNLIEIETEENNEVDTIKKENYGWQLENIEVFEEPIEAKGKLSLWEYDMK